MSEERFEVFCSVDTQAEVLELERKHGLDVLRIRRHQSISEEWCPHTQRADRATILLCDALKVGLGIDGEDFLMACSHAVDDVCNA
jgi:hypothetical protein